MEYQECFAPNKPEQQLDSTSQVLLGAAALGSPVAAPLAGDSSSEEGSSGASCSTHDRQLAGRCWDMADQEQRPGQQQQVDGAQHEEDGEQDLEPEVIVTITEPQEHHHHLLRHCLNTDQRRQALQHFGSDDVREAAREIGRMGQRELQLKFKVNASSLPLQRNERISVRMWARRNLWCGRGILLALAVVCWGLMRARTTWLSVAERSSTTRCPAAVGVWKRDAQQQQQLVAPQAL